MARSGAPRAASSAARPDAAAVRCPPALETGRGARRREPAVDLVDAQPHDPIPRRRRDRGVQAADRGGAGSDQVTDIITPATVRLCAAQRHGDVLAVVEVDVRPAERGDLAAPQRPVEQEPHDRAVDEAAARGRLRALEAAAGAPPPGAGLQEGRALVGRQAAGPPRGGGASAASARRESESARRVSGPAIGSSPASRAARLTAATPWSAVAGARPDCWRWPT